MDFAFLNAAGKTVRINTGLDLTGASELWIKYMKPDGVSGRWSGSQNGTNIEYTTTWPDLDVVGVWQMQSQVVGLSGLTDHGEVETFEVRRPLH